MRPIFLFPSYVRHSDRGHPFTDLDVKYRSGKILIQIQIQIKYRARIQYKSYTGPEKS